MSEVNTKNGGFEFRESGGYDRAQVDSFINEVKKYIASQKNEKQLLTQKLHVLAVKIQEYQSQEAENGTLAERAESLRNEAELFEAKIEELKNAQSALEADIAAKTEEVEAKKAELSKVEASVETMKTEAFGLDAAIKAKNSALDSAAKRVAELENEEARLAIAAGEELNTKTAETRAAVAEKLAELTNSFCENVTAIKAILDNAPVVSVAVNTAPAAPAEVPAAAPVEEAPVEAEETEDEEETAESVILSVEDLLAEEDEAEPTDEELRLTRDTARSVLRSVAGFDAEEDDDSPTKIMPEDITQMNMISGGNSVDIVINAHEDAEEETGWCAPEDSVEEEEEAEAEAAAEEEAEAPVEEAAEPAEVTVLTAEEAEGLSYDDALALVLKKNGIEYKEPEKAAEPVKEAKVEAVEAAPAEKPVKEEKPKKEKRGFFAALKRNIDAILDDEDDEEDSEFSGTEVFTPESAKKNDDSQPTLRFGRDHNGSKK